MPIFGWLLITTLFATIGCERSAQVQQAPDAPQTLTLQLNWFPEAEHGGFYTALINKEFKNRGLDVTIAPGGRAASLMGELATGRAAFAVTNAEDVVLFRDKGADVVAVMAVAQHHPRCIMVRADSGVDSLQSLKGLTLQVQPGRPYLEFLRKQGLLEGVTEVPYAGSVAQTVTNPKFGQQAYIYSEPLVARQQGADVKTFMVSDLGFDPYSSILVTTSKMIRDQPELVRKMVTASIAGWQSYLQLPESTNAYILTQNEQGMTSAALTEGVEILRPMCWVESGSLAHLGSMTEARWQTLVQQMTDIGLAKDVRPEECFDLSFLPQVTDRL